MLFVNFRVTYVFIKSNLYWDKSNALKGIKRQFIFQHGPITQFSLAFQQFFTSSI